MEENTIAAALRGLGVAENAPAGTIVGTFTLSSPNLFVSYGIVGGTGAAALVLDYNSETGQGTLRVAEGATLDYEVARTLTIEVAPFFLGFPIDDAETVTIALRDLDETPGGSGDFNYPLPAVVINTTEDGDANSRIVELDISELVPGAVSGEVLDVYGKVVFPNIGMMPADDDVMVEVVDGKVRVTLSPELQALSTGDQLFVNFLTTVQTASGVETFTTELVIDGVNDAPSDIGLSASVVAENAPAGTEVGQVLVTDIDSDGPFTVALIGRGANQFAIADDGVTIVTTGPLDFEAGAKVPLDIQVTDSDGGVRAERVFVMVINVEPEGPVDPVNTPPAPTNPTVELAEVDSISFDAMDLGSDADGDTVTVTEIGRPVITRPEGVDSAFTVGLADGVISVDVNADGLDDGETIAITVPYTLSDGTDTAGGTIALTVVGENDAPVAAQGTKAALAEVDSATLAVDQLGSDVDGEPLIVTIGAVTILSAPANLGDLSTKITATLDANGALVITSDLPGLVDGEVITGTVGYTLSDGDATADGTVSFTITGEGDPDPIPLNPMVMLGETDSITARAAALGKDSEGADVDIVTVGPVTILTAPERLGDIADRIQATLNTTTDKVTLTSDLNELAAGETVTGTVDYVIEDESGNQARGVATFTITGENDAPVAEEVALSLGETDSVTLTGADLASDIDGDALTAIIVGPIDITLPERLQGMAAEIRDRIEVTLDAAGNVVVTVDVPELADDEQITGTIGYTVTDGTENAEGVVSFTINGEETLDPDPINPEVTIGETDSTTLDGADLGVDLEGGPVGVGAVAAAVIDSAPERLGDVSDSIQVTLGEDGEVTLSSDLDELAAGETVTGRVAYTITDETGNKSNGEISFTIQGENDAPVAANPTADASEVDTVAFAASVLGSDIDGDTLTVSVGAVTILSAPGLLGDVSDRITVSVNEAGELVVAGEFPELVDGQIVRAAIGYTLSDGLASTSGEVEVTFNGEGDPDPIPLNPAVTLGEADSVTTGAALLGQDVQGGDVDIVSVGPVTFTGAPERLEALLADRITASLDEAADAATLVSDLDELAAGETVTGTVTYVIEDEDGNQTQGAVTFTVQGENDAPETRVLGVTLDEVDSVSGDASDLAKDIDGDTLVVTAVGPVEATGPERLGDITGLVTVTLVDGTVTLTANAAALNDGEEITGSFSYTVSDGTTTTEGQVSFVVFGETQDTPPVIEINAPLAVDRFGAVAITTDSVYAVDEQDDDGDVALRIVSLPVAGLLLLNGVPVQIGDEIPQSALGGQPGDDDTSSVLSLIHSGAPVDQITFEVQAVDSTDLTSDTVEVVVEVRTPANAFDFQAGPGTRRNANGGNGNDQLIGDGRNNVLAGRGGRDGIDGGGGNDTIYGDFTGSDSRNGADYLDGGSGDDTVVGGEGNDVILGGTGDDTLYGDFAGPASGFGNDTISGGAGDDSIIGGDGTDTIQGGVGNDTILADFAAATAGAGNDIVSGGAGDDTITGGDGSDTLNGDQGNDDILGDFATSTSGARGDTINGGVGDDRIVGGGGSDTLDGGADNDIIVGDYGQLSGSGLQITNEDGNDTLNGGAGDDLLIGGGGSDTLNGGDGNDTLIGDLGGQVFTNERGDTLNGGNGNDTLRGDRGNDTLTGGTGSDIFILVNDGSSDTITDFESGVDSLDLSSFGTVGVNFSLNALGGGLYSVFNLDLDQVVATVTIQGDAVQLTDIL